MNDFLTVRASFNPLVRRYLVAKGAVLLAVTVVLLPLALVWLCGVGQWWARHYFAKLDCELDGRSLRFRKGILFQIEKTIPLEAIQDVTFVEGPILRRFHLSLLRFETAGQGGAGKSDLQLIGIIDAQDFRNLIFEARETLRARHAAPAGRDRGDVAAALATIQQSLDRIVDLLATRR